MAGFSDTITGLSGSGTVDNSTGAGGVLTVNLTSTTNVFSGTIQDTTGALGLTKTGTGLLELSGTNANSGATTVSQGTLQLGSAGALFFQFSRFGE